MELAILDCGGIGAGAGLAQIDHSPKLERATGLGEESPAQRVGAVGDRADMPLGLRLEPGYADALLAHPGQVSDDYLGQRWTVLVPCQCSAR
jgi:hypothetical protein